jgi:TRAP-type uncharacterized transport system substrate-binding protein
MTYFLRTATDPISLLPAVKEKIREVDKNQTFFSAATIDQLVYRHAWLKSSNSHLTEAAGTSRNEH